MTKDSGKSKQLRGTTMLYMRGASPSDRQEPAQNGPARTPAPEATPGAQEYLADRLAGARDLYLLALALLSVFADFGSMVVLLLRAFGSDRLASLFQQPFAESFAAKIPAPAQCGLKALSSISVTRYAPLLRSAPATRFP